MRLKLSLFFSAIVIFCGLSASATAQQNTAQQNTFDLSWTCVYQDEDSSQVLRGIAPLVPCNGRFHVGAGCTGPYQFQQGNYFLYIFGYISSQANDFFSLDSFYFGVTEGDAPLESQVTEAKTIGASQSGMFVKKGRRFTLSAVVHEYSTSSTEASAYRTEHGLCSFTILQKTL